MSGIDLNCDIKYIDASMRFFEPGEHHITRRDTIDVLVMVLSGVLRFSEDGIQYEVFPGQYHIQKANSMQVGNIVSDTPSYLYVHFNASWNDSAAILPKRGNFSRTLLPDIEALAKAARGGCTRLEATALFYKILAKLYNEKRADNTAGKIADYLCENYNRGISIGELSDKFNFSKNHIINIFKAEYQKTPFEYITLLRIKEAERLLLETSRTLESIAYECGFGDYSHFYKVFRRENGISPKKWRHLRRI